MKKILFVIATGLLFSCQSKVESIKDKIKAIDVKLEVCENISDSLIEETIKMTEPTLTVISNSDRWYLPGGGFRPGTEVERERAFHEHDAVINSVPYKMFWKKIGANSKVRKALEEEKADLEIALMEIKVEEARK